MIAQPDSSSFAFTLDKQEIEDLRAWMLEKGYSSEQVQARAKRLLLEDLAR